MKEQNTEIRDPNRSLVEENKLLKELVNLKLNQNSENLKKSPSTDLKYLYQQQSAKSIKPSTPAPVLQPSSSESKDVRSAQPHLSWSLVANMFNNRKQQIPIVPQPISLKPSAHKPRAYGQNSQRYREQYRGNRRAQEMEEDAEEEEYEYEVIEEDEESESDEGESGVIYHW